MSLATLSFFTLFQSMRPPFLVLTPICVFLGLSSALSAGFEIDIKLFIIILIGALTAHISVNMLNEYYDFKSGLDLKTNKTPFSGGSGALPNNPSMAKLVLMVGLLALLLTLILGIYLLLNHSREILPLGIIGILLIITYTQWLNKYPLLCLIAPGLGFGLLMVMGTHVLLTKSYTDLNYYTPLIPFFLVNNLLLLNQYPDIKADLSVGRNTFPIAFGIHKSNIMYAFSLLSVFILLTVNMALNNLPLLSLMALLPLSLSIFSLIGAKQHAENIGQHPQYLASNVAATLLTPLLLGLSMIYG